MISETIPPVINQPDKNKIIHNYRTALTVPFFPDTFISQFMVYLHNKKPADMFEIFEDYAVFEEYEDI